ncbi:polysaccharide deacetylase family protein [Clostridium sp. Marseille-QA1073]
MKSDVKRNLIIVIAIIGFFSLGWLIGLYTNKVKAAHFDTNTSSEINEKDQKYNFADGGLDKEENSNTPKEKIREETEVDGENIEKPIERKTAYLTFDDGPTTNITPQVLDILDKYNIKATFFVIGSLAEVNKEVLKDIEIRGHTIGNHTYSHDYDLIYSSVNTFMEDIDKADEVLGSILPNYERGLFRFPTGSFKKYQFIEAVKDKGYKHYDWNALNGDAEALNVPANKLIRNVKKTVCDKNKVIILMHDSGTKQTTVDSLPDIIDYLIEEGYSFETLDNYK